MVHEPGWPDISRSDDFLPVAGSYEYSRRSKSEAETGRTVAARRPRSSYSKVVVAPFGRVSEARGPKVDWYVREVTRSVAQSGSAAVLQPGTPFRVEVSTRPNASYVYSVTTPLASMTRAGLPKTS